MSLLKKVLISLFIITLLAVAGGSLLLKRIGINPFLWISPLSSSQVTTHGMSIHLEPLELDFSQITDFQFFPNNNHVLLVLQKTGELFEVDLSLTTKKLLLTIDVLSDSEQGLLGVAIHPSYPKIPCIYLNTVVRNQNKDISQVSEWCNDWEGDVQRWYQNKVIFEVEQPYKNHNAGHLIFDQAGLLYIPWGDGGSREDPQGNAQNLQSYLGKILRINPEAFNPEIPYSIPTDNPFINNPDVLDEIYAYGLRNPWKLAFDTQGRLIAADVGQDAWEEVTFIQAGANHGWNSIEAMHCFKENCSAEDTILPFVEYGHELGRSITGGYQWLSEDIPELQGKYIYGDFVTGQLWAADLPDTINTNAQLSTNELAQSQTTTYELGQWPLLISSFARDHNGSIFIADFARGKIYKILPSNKNIN